MPEPSSLDGAYGREQRRAAIWALYQSDLSNARSMRRSRVTRTSSRGCWPPRSSDHQPELDELISRYASGWSLGRIAPLERSILRVGLLELTRPELLPGDQAIPPEGAINEAVETAKEFCGADAPGFVNGILAAALRDHQSTGA